MQILLEAKNDFNTDRWNATWSAVVGAYDPETSDSVSIKVTQPSDGTLTLSTMNRDVPQLLQNCDQAENIEVHFIAHVIAMLLMLCINSNHDYIGQSIFNFIFINPVLKHIISGHHDALSEFL